MRIKLNMLLLCLAAMSGRVLAGISDEIAIIIGDNVVTRSEFNQERDLYKKFQSITSMSKEQEKQFLDWFIDTQLQLEMGRRMKIGLGTEELGKIHEELLKKNKMDSLDQLKEVMASRGEDYDGFMKNIARQVLLSKINEIALLHRIKVSDNQVESAYKKELDRDTKLYIEDIVFYIDGVKKELREGLGEKSAAVSNLWKTRTYNRYSVPKQSKMLSFKWEKMIDLPGEFQSVVADMDVGDVSAPIKTDNGYHVLKLIKRRLPENNKVDKNQIRQSLMARKMLSEIPKWLKELKEQIYVHVALD